MNWRPALVPGLLLSLLAGSTSPRGNWVVYYADQARPDEFREYDLIVFDSDHHPALASLRNSGATVLGYLSLCEVEKSRKWFSAAQTAGLLLGEQTNWPGSHLIDIRDLRWRRMVVKQLAHEILAQGFRGLFLDTLDDAAEMERNDPKKFAGMKTAAIQLVAELRREFPGAVLMVNRGYDLLPALLPSIDIALGESVYGTYDFATKTYRTVSADDYRYQVELLRGLKQKKPNLRVCTLDYWNPADREGIRHVYREERANGFEPYVTTVALDQLSREPK